MPHQEARFLCPLLVPLILIYTYRQPKLSASFWTAWFLFNIITTYVFGVVHQGGLIPTMSFLHRQVTGLHDCRVINRDLTCIAGGNSMSLL
jgi:phosphatidylinositol glycan class Z